MVGMSRTITRNCNSLQLTLRSMSFINNVSSSSTVDSAELHHFKEFSKDWWNESGPMKGLHSINKLRVPLIRDGLINANSLPQQVVNNPKPLNELKILDVGCGGGILTEPLARIGANITGLDANQELIEIAKSHSSAQNLPNLQYICSTIEDHACHNIEKYDAVVASEVIEHITQKEEFLKGCVKCLKPGGSIFLTTLNKTALANFGAISLGENLCKFLPKGTHEYNKFIKPHHLQRMLEDENCKTLLVHGIIYNFFSNEWYWSRFKQVNYALHAVKLSSKESIQGKD